MSAYDWSAIRAAYESGASLDVIFERYGVSLRTVHRAAEVEHMRRRR